MEFGREEIHVQGYLSADKYITVRNMENDTPPLPFAALANHVPKQTRRAKSWSML
jgi:hypothetical protein